MPKLSYVLWATYLKLKHDNVDDLNSQSSFLHLRQNDFAPSDCSSPSSFTGIVWPARRCPLVLGGSGFVRASQIAFCSRSSFIALSSRKRSVIYGKLCLLLFITLLPRPALCRSCLLGLGWLGKSKATVFDTRSAPCRLRTRWRGLGWGLQPGLDAEVTGFLSARFFLLEIASSD